MEREYIYLENVNRTNKEPQNMNISNALLVVWPCRALHELMRTSPRAGYPCHMASCYMPTLTVALLPTYATRNKKELGQYTTRSHPTNVFCTPESKTLAQNCVYRCYAIHLVNLTHRLASRLNRVRLRRFKSHAGEKQNYDINNFNFGNFESYSDVICSLKLLKCLPE